MWICMIYMYGDAEYCILYGFSAFQKLFAKREMKHLWKCRWFTKSSNFQRKDSNNDLECMYASQVFLKCITLLFHIVGYLGS